MILNVGSLTQKVFFFRKKYIHTTALYIRNIQGDSVIVSLILEGDKEKGV